MIGTKTGRGFLQRLARSPLRLEISCGGETGSVRSVRWSGETHPGPARLLMAEVCSAEGRKK